MTRVPSLVIVIIAVALAAVGGMGPFRAGQVHLASAEWARVL
jgi:hypothetical protein